MMTRTSCTSMVIISIKLGSAEPKQQEFPISGPVTTCLPVHCCVGVQHCIITPVFSEFLVCGLCIAQPFKNATLHPPFIQVLFFVVIGYTFFTGGPCKVIIAVTIL